jgi:hypothetical protein
MPAPNSRARNARQHGFQKNNTLSKGIRHEYPTETDTTSYVRLNQAAFDDRANENDQILTFNDVDGAQTSVSPLRPKSNPPTLTELHNTDDLTVGNFDASRHPDLFTNRVYMPFALNNMYNTEIKNHCTGKLACGGDMIIDAAASRRWGAVWYERLMCTDCPHKSGYYPLFEQVDSSKRGRKPAKANIQLQLGTYTLPLGNTGVRRILASMNVAPPALSSMQRLSSSIGESLVLFNTQDMALIREDIKKQNAVCGHKNPVKVNVEGDSCYNNPIFQADSTPFQAGTIVTTTFCENNTNSKKIIGLSVQVKICQVASELRNKGNDVMCPNHKGHCSATIEETDAIGNEARWNESVTRQINQTLSIHSFCGDGDSKGHSGVDKGQQSSVIHLKDLRHMANSMRRQINKAQFSALMFSGQNKANFRNRFSLSIKHRCICELKKAHSLYKGNVHLIAKRMQLVMVAIVKCFKGDCGERCAKDSLVCRGDRHQAKNYMPARTKLRIDFRDELVLYGCLGSLLSLEAIRQTRFLSSTQKCESVNRSYVSCMPKFATFSRNAKARVHSQAMKINHGFSDSHLMKASHLGASYNKGSKVMKYLQEVEHRRKLLKSLKYRQRAKLNRYAGRLRRYKIHAEVHYKKGLTDIPPDFSNPRLRDHLYVL